MAIEVVAYQPELAQIFAGLHGEAGVDDQVLQDPKTHIIEPGGNIFFARVEGEIVGTVAMIPHTDKTFELAKLIVEPDHQGQGIGRELIETCLAFAKDYHLDEITLSANAEIEGAICLYESVGFMPTGTPSDAPGQGTLEMSYKVIH